MSHKIWILGLFVLTLGLGACSSTNPTLRSVERSTASEGDEQFSSYVPTIGDIRGN